MSKTREQELEDALRLAISGFNDIPNTRLRSAPRGLRNSYELVAYLEMVEREGRPIPQVLNAPYRKQFPT